MKSPNSIIGTSCVAFIVIISSARNYICGASRQKSTNVGNFKIELGARYDSRSVYLSFLFKISFLSILFEKLWYNSLLWNRGVRNMNFAEIGSKVRSVKNTQYLRIPIEIFDLLI